MLSPSHWRQRLAWTMKTRRIPVVPVIGTALILLGIGLILGFALTPSSDGDQVVPITAATDFSSTPSPEASTKVPIDLDFSGGLRPGASTNVPADSSGTSSPEGESANDPTDTSDTTSPEATEAPIDSNSSGGMHPGGSTKAPTESPGTSSPEEDSENAPADSNPEEDSANATADSSAPTDTVKQTETMSEDCPDLDVPGDISVPYYRLRFEYKTSSDHSKLVFTDTQHVMKVRTMSIDGDATKALATFEGIIVNQPKDNAELGSIISITADYALRPAALAGPLSVRLDKGGLGEIALRVLTIVGSETSVIYEATVTDDSEFDLDLTSLKDVASTLAPIASVRRMAWALYYPWYSLNSWDTEKHKDTPQFLYDSSDPVDVERQINQAKSAGIGGFISSWWGAGSRTDENLQVLLDVAAENDFFVGMFLETKKVIDTMNDDLPLIEQELGNWIQHYVTAYGEHPGTMRVDGKPFIMPWISCKLPVETWQNVRQSLDAVGIEVTLIADCDQEEYFDVFDGALGDEAETGKTLRYYAMLADEPAPKIWFSSAKPGYDERLLPDRNPPRYTDRENGMFFRRQLNTALQANPQWLRLYTWNEYPENTYIEPSESYGDEYLKIATDYVLPWICQA